MSPGTRIDYKKLRELSPEAAREAVLQYLLTPLRGPGIHRRLFGGGKLTTGARRRNSFGFSVLSVSLWFYSGTTSHRR